MGKHGGKNESEDGQALADMFDKTYECSSARVDEKIENGEYPYENGGSKGAGGR